MIEKQIIHAVVDKFNRGYSQQVLEIEEKTEDSPDGKIIHTLIIRDASTKSSLFMNTRRFEKDIIDQERTWKELLLNVCETGIIRAFW